MQFSSPVKKYTCNLFIECDIIIYKFEKQHILTHSLRESFGS